MLFTGKTMAQVVDGGTTGDCSWELTGTEGNYTLTISGNGAMADYDYNNSAPWYSYKNDITTMDIQQGVTHIGDEAFSYCNNLTSVDIPNSVTIIGDAAFESCSGLTSVTIPNSVKTIGDAAFLFCIKLTTISIPNSVTIIGDIAFAQCGRLTSINIPNSVTYIGDGAFNFSGLTGALIIPNSVKTIGEAAFSQCLGLTSVTLPDSIRLIENSVFENCSNLKGRLTIPNSVTSIGDRAFYYCDNLTSIIIGRSVTAIGVYTFAECSGLTDLYVRATNPPLLANDAFYKVSRSIRVHVPCEKASDYQEASDWSDFTEIIEDIPLFDVTVQSRDTTMGTVNIKQLNTCANNTAIIEATANTGYRFVQWNDGDNQNLRTVAVTQDTSFTATFEPVNAIPNIETTAISVCPNPATDNINIVLPENMHQAIFTLYDMQGKILIRQNINNQDAVSVNNLVSGMYIYNVKTEKNNCHGKIIKQ
jgi:hypothetical protein